MNWLQRLFGRRTENDVALLKASGDGDLKRVQELLAAGANVNVREDSGHTPLMNACTSDKRVEIVRALINAKADINTRSNSGQTALMMASRCAYHDPVVVEELLRAGAEVNAVDNLGSTALMGACDQARENACRVLLQAGANASIANKKGRTALTMAKANPFARDVVALLMAPPTKGAGKASLPPQSSGTSNANADMKELVWSVVSPLQTTLQDPNKIIAFGPQCVPIIIDIFLHPKEPSTGIACNQAVLACVLDVFARKNDRNAALFLRRIANDEIDLFDDGGRTAYEMAKAFVSDNPLP